MQNKHLMNNDVKKMIIGFILDDTLDRSDGVQQAILSIGNELTNRGHDVHYIVSETHRKDVKNVHSISKYFNLQFNGNSVRTPFPASRKKIKVLLNKVDFDVLHVQMPYSPFFAARVLRLASAHIKKFGTFHILPYSNTTKLGTSILGRVLKSTTSNLNATFAVSRPALQFMDSTFHTKGSIIPNPVDYSFFNTFKKQSNQKKQIVFVGRFEKRKGVLELVEAFAKLPKEIRLNTTLTMCGKGPLHTEVSKLSDTNNLDIVLPGFVSEDEKAQFLANADIAVFPSKSGESFGIVLVEAMAAASGIVLGGNNPGYASVLQDWPITLFDPTDKEAFTALLSKCLIGDEKIHRVGESQHTVSKKYDISTVVDNLEAHYTCEYPVNK